MTTTTTESAPRTYGGWRRRRGIGLGGLTGAQSLLVLIPVLAVLFAAAVSGRLALALLLPALLCVVAAFARWDGVWAADAILARSRWAAAVRANRTRTRAQNAARRAMPGVLAPLECRDIPDGTGGTYGVVLDSRQGLLTATLRVAAPGTLLADRVDADGWVASWGAWLAALGDDPTVTWVTVTVDTAPNPGTTLREAADRRLDHAAPAAALAMMRDLVETAPSVAASIETRVSITFDPSRSPYGRGDLEVVAGPEVSRTLLGLQAGLGACGVSVLGRLGAAEIAAVVRGAFDPAARGQLSSTAPQDSPLGWADAIPEATEERWDSYAHDTGVSVSWALREAPTQHVTSDVLTRFTAPRPYMRRVTLGYQVLDSAAAARTLDHQVNAVAFREQYRAATKRDETARDRADRDRAEAAAREEAQGAGVALVTAYVTATVTDPAQLAAATADVEQSAGSARLRLRRMYGSQSAGFAATLPCGIYPPHLARRSTR